MLRRVLAFGSVPLLAMVAPLLVLPIIASTASTSEWAALAVGQSVGALAGIAIGLGLPLNGPVEVARATPSRVRQIYTESLLARGVAFCPVVFVAALIAYVAAPPGTRGLTIAVALATSVNGFSANWVAIGLGKARMMIIFEVLPRLSFTVVAAVLILNGGSIGLYPALIAGGGVSGVVLFSVLGVRPGRIRGVVLATRRRLREQMSSAATTISASAYSTGALLLVGLSTTVPETAAVASADRVYRLGLFAITALTNALQAWVVEPDGGLSRARRRRALTAHAGLGMIGGLSFAAFGPFVTEVLFGARLATGFAVTACYGVAFVSVAISSSLARHYLVPAGRIRATLLTTLAGVGVGVPAVLVLGSTGGAGGAAAGLALGEVVVTATLGAILLSRQASPTMMHHVGNQGADEAGYRQCSS